MKEKLVQLADMLISAIGSDTPRAIMRGVSDQLRALATEVPNDDGRRAMALDLANALESHQYGIRFGDGAVSRGRELVSSEKNTVVAALRAYGRKPGTAELPKPTFYHYGDDDGQLWRTSPLFGVPKTGEGLYTEEQVRALLDKE